MRIAHGFPEKNLFTKMTGLAINEPPAFLAYGTFLCRDRLCYQRVCEYTGHTSRSPAYSDKVDTHWDFQITVMTVETILWIKLVPRDMLEVLNSL